MALMEGQEDVDPFDFIMEASWDDGPGWVEADSHAWWSGCPLKTDRHVASSSETH